uniref:HTH myb-type domain-containing protein n=1 Tax=Zea mays TaxID=4577 RepID=B6TMP0_MAIZE|nr:hypothetical protein [Zea mays]
MRPASSPELSIRLARALISYAGGAPESRAEEVRQELQAEVHQLSRADLGDELRARLQVVPDREQLPGRTGNDVRNRWNTKLRASSCGSAGSTPPPPSPASCTSSSAPSPYGDDGTGTTTARERSSTPPWTATRRHGWTSSSPSCWPTRPTTLAPPPRWAGSWA